MLAAVFYGRSTSVHQPPRRPPFAGRGGLLAGGRVLQFTFALRLRISERSSRMCICVPSSHTWQRRVSVRAFRPTMPQTCAVGNICGLRARALTLPLLVSTPPLRPWHRAGARAAHCAENRRCARPFIADRSPGAPPRPERCGFDIGGRSPTFSAMYRRFQVMASPP